MQEYIIDVTQIEEWQTIRDLDSLERVFQRAKSRLKVGCGQDWPPHLLHDYSGWGWDQL